MSNGLQLPAGKIQLFDDAGSPLALGKVDYFIPGTTTRKNTWQDEGQTIANTNPVTLDAGGRASVWGTGLYRMVVKTAAGATVYDQVTGSLTGPDDVTAIPANVQNGAYVYAADQGAANAYAITLTPALAGYVDGQTFFFKAGHSNTGSSTLNAGPGPVPLVQASGAALSAGTIIVGSVYEATYRSGSFQLMNSAGASVGTIAFRNRVFNGAAQCDQYNVGGVANLTATPTYIIDRWKACRGAAGTATMQQSLNGGPLVGSLLNCISVAIGVGASPGAADTAYLQQPIEGAFLPDTGFGAAGAQTLSLSFWFQASIGGNYSAAVQNSAQNRSYPFMFAAVGGNTWELITVAIPGDVAGTWLTTTGVGLRLFFDLGSGVNFQGVANTWQAGNFTRIAGSVIPVANGGSTINITGVQLEVAPQATTLEYRFPDDELRHCQRYYWRMTALPLGMTATASSCGGGIKFPVTMRAIPTIGAITFAVGGGSAGTGTSIAPSTEGVIIYNSAANWTIPTNVQVSTTASAELT